MKKALFLFALIGAAFAMNAQTLVIINDGMQLSNGDTITVTSTIAEPVVRPQIFNQTGSTVTAKCEVETINAPGMTVLSVCAGNCLAGNVSPEFDIEPSGTYTGLFIDFDMGSSNEGLFKMKVYSVSDPDNLNAYAYIKLKKSADIDQVADAMQLSAQPNPCKGQTEIRIEQANGGELVVCNMMGRIVRRVALDANASSLNLDVTDLPAGMYLYGIHNGAKNSAMQKLVVE